MKKYLSLPIIILFVFSFLILGKNASGTVGGEVYIYDIAYSASENSVYYIRKEYGGKGCPPVVYKIDLTNNQNAEIRTCDEILTEFYRRLNLGDENYSQDYEKFISELYSDLSYLGSVSLIKNHIDIKVSVISRDESPWSGFFRWAKFRATIFQDNKEVAKIDFTGCVDGDFSQDLPHIFEGYRIPNSDAMAILISRLGNACDEGGYKEESLHLIRGIKYYDTDIIMSRKTKPETDINNINRAKLEVYGGNLVVYPSSIDDSTNTPANQSDLERLTPQITLKDKIKNWATLPIILIGTAILIVGILLGYLIGYLIGRRTARFIDKNLPNSNQ